MHVHIILSCVLNTSYILYVSCTFLEHVQAFLIYYLFEVGFSNFVDYL